MFSGRNLKICEPIEVPVVVKFLGECETKRRVPGMHTQKCIEDQKGATHFARYSKDLKGIISLFKKSTPDLHMAEAWPYTAAVRKKGLMGRLPNPCPTALPFPG